MAVRVAHNLRVPYMDKALAERIAALEETDRKAVMADVLEPWAIDALCTRFGHVKRSIRAELESEDTHRYLDSNANWKSPEVMEKLKSLTDEYGVTSKRGTNYVSNFLLSADLTRFGIVGAFDYRGFLNADYEAGLAKAALKEAQDLNDEEKAAAKPQEFGVSENVISYLKETRQLLAGHALFKRPPPKELSTPIVNKIPAGKKARRQPPKNSFFRSMIPAVAVRPSGLAQIAADYLSFRQAVLTVHGENDTIRDAESH